jgi:probable rRNA maturation factor
MKVHEPAKGQPGKAPRLALSVQTLGTTTRLPVDRAQCRRWVQAACISAAPAAWPVSLSLVFTDKKHGQALNREHRHKDYPTNVLTFAYTQAPVHADIVICMPIVREEAKTQGKAMRTHLAHLVIHGCLHALGYDHEDDSSAQAMEDIERKLLMRFRIADPYL